jgi:hypothetical protein
LKKNISEFHSHPVLRLFENSANTSMNLPVKEIPEIAWDEPDKWINVSEFGASGNDTIDDSDAIQAAIDNQDKKTTLYFPVSGKDRYIINKDVYVRGDIKRIFGANFGLPVPEELFLMKVHIQVVFMERFSRPLGGNGPAIVHQSTRTLVISDAVFNGITGNGSGDLFMDNVVGGPHSFIYSGQNIWCRQLNSEQGRTMDS